MTKLLKCISSEGFAQGGMKMRERLAKYFELQERTLWYLRENEEEVVQSNQGVLRTVSLLLMFVLIFYNIVVPLNFASWGVTRYYQAMFILHLFVLAYVFLRFHGAERSLHETNITCMVFQLYTMVFIGIVSIVPVWKEQDAIYFAPLALFFLVAFEFTWDQTVGVLAIEVVGINIASFLLKSEEVININLFATILTFAIGVFVSHLLYKSRIDAYEQRMRIEEISRIDMMTQIYNRAAMEKKCLQYIEKNPKASCTLAIIDVDDFKRVNDNLGHPMGDFVLKNVARVLRESATDHSFCGRIGGDEFMMFFTKENKFSDVDDALTMVNENVREIDTQSDIVKISTSIGAAEKRPGTTTTYEELFTHADQALYIVKEKGKNGHGFYEGEDI